MQIRIVRQMYCTQTGQAGESFGVLINGRPKRVFYSFDALRNYMEEIGAGVSFFLAR